MTEKKDKIVTLETLPIKASTPLTEGSKTQLIKIIENEFKNQTTLFDAQLQEARTKFLDKYKKEVDFTKKLATVKKLQAELHNAQVALNDTGLDENGKVQGYGKAGQAVFERMDESAKLIQPATNHKNKIITRMLMCSTYGEAMVIMNSVLGNGILPSMTTAQIEHKE